MENSSAETSKEEIERLIDFLDMKSRELMDEEYRENYPRPEKSKNMSNLANILRNKMIPKYEGREDVIQVLNELVDWCDEKVDAENPDYSLVDMSCFVELSREIRRRLINYEEGLMDTTLKVREEWEDKYG